MDSIINAYRMLHTASIKKSNLPAIFCGKDDLDHLEEQADDPWDVADFKKRLMNNEHLAIPDDGKEHDAAIGQIVKAIGNRLPKSEDLTLVHSMINQHPDKDVRHVLHQKYFAPINASMSKIEDDGTKPSPWLTKPDIETAAKKNLKFDSGRRFKVENPYITRANSTVHLDESGNIHSTSPYRESGAFHIDDEGTVQEVKALHQRSAESASEHIKWYTDDSKEINSYLADKHYGKERDRQMTKSSPEELENSVKQISSDIKSAPSMDRPFHVFTGLSKSSNVMGVTENGTKEAKFHAPAFMSSSFSFQVAADFAKNKHATEHEANHPDGVHDVLHIEVPEKFKGGMYIDSVSRNAGEREYLIDHAHDFTIHPNPRYTAYGGKLIRVWQAKIHPKT